MLQALLNRQLMLKDLNLTKKDSREKVIIGTYALTLIPSPSSAHSMLSSSRGTASPLVSAFPSAHPKGYSGDPEMHSIQNSSASIRSPGSLNVHYLGKTAHLISQVFFLKEKKRISFETRT